MGRGDLGSGTKWLAARLVLGWAWAAAGVPARHLPPTNTHCTAVQGCIGQLTAYLPLTPDGRICSWDVGNSGPPEPLWALLQSFSLFHLPHTPKQKPSTHAQAKPSTHAQAKPNPSIDRYCKASLV
eukprot:366045-Chlamydomonas_euryale.AAC.9